MSTPKLKSVAVSVPGKVLIAGGYLVLDSKYFGIVAATTSRFYTIVTQQPFPCPTLASPQHFRVTVHSPQFTDPPREYTFFKEPTTQNLRLLDVSASPNKFIDTALHIALKASMNLMDTEKFDSLFYQGHIHVTLVADNDFYSQQDELRRRGLTPSLKNLRMLPNFVSTQLPIAEVKKTGLGSSATLVTSLLASILLYFTNTLTPNYVHGLSQFVHCYAQGKIGSGFDVASANFGTHCYTRFSTTLISDLFLLG
ncbi:phosphomevalonate kinase, partial [Coelomomyces lativittatus]